MAAGLINYWAAARAAAGTAQEPFQAGTLAEALAAATERHGAPLATVLARCSFVIDGDPVGTRSPETVQLSQGATIDVLPPFAGGSDAAAETAAALQFPLAGAFLSVAGCGLLLLASWGGRPMLGAALLLLQLILVIGWFRLAELRTPGQAAGAVAAVLAAAAADVALLNEVDDASVRPLTVVLAALVVIAFVVQLGRRDGRDRLTDALAATIGAGALCLTMASLLGVRGGASGGAVIATALGAAGVALVIAAGLMSIPLRTSLPQVGLLAVALAVGIGAGTGVGALLGHVGHGVGSGAGLVIGAVAGALALSAVALVTTSGSRPEIATEPASPRSAAVRRRPIAATVPVAVIGPAVLIIGRIMVG